MLESLIVLIANNLKFFRDANLSVKKVIFLIHELYVMPPEIYLNNCVRHLWHASNNIRCAISCRYLPKQPYSSTCTNLKVRTPKFLAAFKLNCFHHRYVDLTQGTLVPTSITESELRTLCFLQKFKYFSLSGNQIQ